MDDPIVDFLRARLDEDEQFALDLGSASWTEEGGALTASSLTSDGGRRIIAEGLRGAVAEWAARYDPAFVLADVAAKRAILVEHRPYLDDDGWKCVTCHDRFVAKAAQPVGFPCLTLRHLASVSAGHPDFREEWRP